MGGLDQFSMTDEDGLISGLGLVDRSFDIPATEFDSLTDP